MRWKQHRQRVSRIAALAMLSLGVIGLGTRGADATDLPAHISSAVTDAGRPPADKARDVNRKPADMLAFFEIKPGQKIAELLPGGGYFTRILSKAVGPTGKVYVLGPPGAETSVKGVVGAATYANVSKVKSSASSLNLPEQVDVVWTALNYHDLKLTPRRGGAPVDMAAFNKAVYRALKPGGYYVVIDHAANSGDVNAPSEKHRIDQLTVVNEAAAAGFLKQGEIQALRRPEDPRTAGSGSLKGLSDQFAILFRKPDLSLGGAIRSQ